METNQANTSNPARGMAISLPFYSNDCAEKGKYLYLAGGYNSIDRGSPDWGTSKTEEALYIGDLAGTVRITYQDGEVWDIPLIFGHTMWFLENFADGGAPFKTEEQDPELVRLLSESLYLYGAYEGAQTPVLRIRLEEKNLASVEIINNEHKRGEPVFTGAYVTSTEGETNLCFPEQTISVDPGFFEQHTADLNTDVHSQLEKIRYALYNFEEDFMHHPPFSPPKSESGGSVEFGGNSLANLASAILYHNLENLKQRTDADGFIHTSYHNAPSWRYNGFGTWVPKANTFYNDFYSRDGARAIMTLLLYGEWEKADKATEFAHEWMMYYPRNGLTLNQKKIPGHFSVMPNKPRIYSEFLTGIGWPTQYTKERFGEDYQNLGNQETDGHGLMMMAAYNVFRNSPSPKEWAQKNWDYIKEGARWILWCFENPNESFAKDGLLYAESEGGMMEYTLYCNIPCYLGLRMYAEIAETAGQEEERAAWLACAEKMEAAITEKLSENGCWRQQTCGFFHDPVLTMFSDYFGYDLTDFLPEQWLAFSQSIYPHNLARPELNGTYFGSTGIGYNHAMITQNALLLDQTYDSGELVSNLSKICYSPRLAEPYLVPECISYDPEQKAVRRQGDLGNLVQLAKVLKCYHLVCGVCPVSDGTLSVLPRLPKDWNMKLTAFPLLRCSGRLSLETAAPKDGAQQLIWQLNAPDVRSVRFRLGPFDSLVQTVAVTYDSNSVSANLFTSGDKKWCWAEVCADGKPHEITAAVH